MPGHGSWQGAQSVPAVITGDRPGDGIRQNPWHFRWPNPTMIRFRSLPLLPLAALLSALPAAHGGVPEGLDAYNRWQYADARKELADPAAQGNPEAMALMGDMLMRGLGGSRDELTARQYILQAHQNGSVRATFLLGRMHQQGALVEKDEAKGTELIKDAANKLYPPAQTIVGAWINGGLMGYEKDESVALTWFKSAADMKDPAAMTWLGSYYENGRGGLDKDNLVALDWYKKAGMLRDTAGMVAAGRMYATGKGVSADGNEALRWMRMAVGQNYASHLWIGSIYEFGRGGVARSPSAAYAWYHSVPGNARPSEVKEAAEGKERLAKSMSAAEVDEAVKQSRALVAGTVIGNLTSAMASQGRKGAYGSGVVVSRAGDIVTNEHVVQDCRNIRIQPSGSDVKLVAKDAKNDLALLRLENGQLPALKTRAGRGIRLGDDLVAVGYPLRGVLSSGPIVTTGIVNALSGSNNDTSAFQMSATVQPGSSGGPIVDSHGLLVGIVRARLLPTGPASPQNVNFGINLATVQSFLDAHNVGYDTAATPGSAKPLSVGDVTALVQKSTVQVECY